MVLGIANPLIDSFASLVDIFANTYSMYRGVRKSHEAILSMSSQTKNESLRAQLKRFRAELVEIEKLDDRLATIDFKRRLYVHSPLSRKLNQKKYVYTTLVECFDISNGITDRDYRSLKKSSDIDHNMMSDQRINR